MTHSQSTASSCLQTSKETRTSYLENVNETIEFRYVGQVEEYLGQVRRSRSYVNGQGHKVKIRFFSMRWHHNNAEET